MRLEPTAFLWQPAMAIRRIALTKWRKVFFTCIGDCSECMAIKYEENIRYISVFH